MDWDDFRYFAAVAEHGSVRGAAGVIGVNPSTVTRRLDRLERDLQARLFIRSPDGLHLTPQGEDLRRGVSGIGRQFQGLLTGLQGVDQAPSGVVRLASADGLLIAPLLAALPDFIHRLPNISLAIGSSGGGNAVARGELDLALEATSRPADSLVGRRLGLIAVGAYAAVERADDIERAPLETAVDWVSWQGDGELAQACGDVARAHVPELGIRLTCDALEHCQTAIAAGVGAGILPCVLAEGDARLRRLLRVPLSQGPPLWLLSHPDQRGAVRIQAVADLVREVIADHKLLLEPT